MMNTRIELPTSTEFLSWTLSCSALPQWPALSKARLLPVPTTQLLLFLILFFFFLEYILVIQLKHGQHIRTDVFPKKTWPTGAKKMFSIIIHQGNAHQNHRILPQTCLSDWSLKKTRTRECWRGCVHRQHLCTAGGNVNWCNLYRE